MFKKYVLIVVAFLCSVSTLLGCSETKKLDEMKDNTSDMRETTKELSKQTGEMKDGLEKMAGTTKEMNQTTKDLLSLTREELIERLRDVSASTGSLFDAMRQGDTSALRRKGMETLLQQTTLQGRVAEAGLYLQGFEFQALGTVWKDTDPRFRELLYHQAMLEFFLKIDELAPKLGEVEPTAKPSIDDDVENRTSAFNAIAFALHKTNRLQLPDQAYGKPMSFYDLIMVALALKPEIDSGRIVLPPGPSYIKEVLGHPERVRQLLQTRYNMFVYALLGSTTNLSERGSFAQLWKLLWKLDLDLSEKTVGPAVLQRLNDEIFTPAARTTTDMLSVGIVPAFTGKTKFTLAHIDVQFHTAAKKTEFVRMTENESTMSTLWKQYTNPNPVWHRGYRR
jgi:hypothetical protein